MTAQDAFSVGYEHGQMVPAYPASSDMAWSDLRATSEKIPSSLESDYVRGHMAGQSAEPEQD
jgi:hypothetical protein